MSQKRFYFTYGTGHWAGGGWTTVFAESEDEAIELFCRKHPRTDRGLIACSCIYDEDTFRRTSMFKNGNFGKKCVEIINLEV